MEGNPAARVAGEPPTGLGVSPGLLVRGEQVAHVGPRIPDRTHLPVDGNNDPRRILPPDQHVPQPEVAVDDGRGDGRRGVRPQAPRQLVHGGDAAGRVDGPELGEAAQLPLDVAARTPEADQSRLVAGDGVNLGEHVHELQPEGAAGGLVPVERARQLLLHDQAVDVRHDVERDTEHVRVVADREDRRNAHAERRKR